MPLATRFFMADANTFNQGLVKSNLLMYVDSSVTASYSGTGNTWYDLSGNGNNMTLSSCAYSGTYSGIVLNGTSSWIYSSNNLKTAIEATNYAQTQEIWFWNTTPLGAYTNGVVLDELGAQSVNATGWHDSQFEIVGGQGVIRVWNNGQVNLNAAFTGPGKPANPSFGKWTYVAWRYNTQLGKLDGFVNGLQTYSGSAGQFRTAIQPASGYYPALGSADSTNIGDGNYFQGMMRVYRNYNVALSNEEILRNYNYDVSNWVPVRNIVRVNVIAAGDTASWYSDVLTKIQSAMTGSWSNKSLVITQNNSASYAGGDISVANYDVCFIWSNSAFTNSALGTALNNFVTAGGGFVICVFANASVNISGFTYTNCPTVFPGNQSMSSQTLGTYTSNDPLMKNVTTFNVGGARYGAGGLTLQSGATTVASYNDSNILVAKKTMASGAQTVSINFFPPSSTAAGPSFWDATTNGGQMMANAIVWAGRAAS